MNAKQELVLPRLSESLTQATVVAWLVAEGDAIVPGDPVVEVDADKFVMGLEVEHPCILERILHPEGARVEVGATLARLAPLPAADPVPAPRPEPAPGPAPAPPRAAPARGGGAGEGEHGFQLVPLTAAGRRFCALAEEHAVAAAARAAECDREGRLPAETLREMQESGLAAACVPERFGGGGVDSLHDLAVGIGRVGRGDASTAIALNMHLGAVWGLTRHWRAAARRGDGAAEPLERLLQQVAEGRHLHCVAGSEPGTDILHPLTEATPVEGGWRIDGKKIFGTLSEVADLVHATVRVREPGGADFIAIASIPRGTPGMSVRGDWDALGMRASGSHGIAFDDCFVTDAMLGRHGRWGEWNRRVLEAQVSGNLGLLGAYLGVAEAARALVLPGLRTRRKAWSGAPLAERPGIQHGVAEMEIALASARAMLGRVAMLADTFFAGPPPADDELGGAHSLMREFQCAKWLVNRRAIEVVDQAMTLSGGSGYASGSPLARLYRDVRAGPFMQLFSPNEAFEYIGRVALGLDPEVG